MTLWLLIDLLYLVLYLVIGSAGALLLRFRGIPNPLHKHDNHCFYPISSGDCIDSHLFGGPTAVIMWLYWVLMWPFLWLIFGGMWLVYALRVVGKLLTVRI